MREIVQRLTEMHTDYEAGRWHQYDAVKELLLDAASEIERIKTIVNQQAEDEGLWFVARTAPEAYLQHELRRLHAAIEGEHNG